MRYDTFNPRPYEVHWWAVHLIKPGSKVLDLGCATGYLAAKLQKKGCTVFGVEKDIPAAKLARRFCQKVVIADLEEPQKISPPAKYFDYVLLLDVLEHLKNRDQLLKFVHQWLAPSGMLIISTPNIAHISVRLKLWQGKFDYQEFGILDKSHVHLFTRETFLSLLEETGFKVDRLLASADFGQLPYIGRIARRIPKYLQFRLTQMLPTLFGVQFVALCHSAKTHTV